MRCLQEIGGGVSSSGSPVSWGLRFWEWKRFWERERERERVKECVGIFFLRAGGKMKRGGEGNNKTI